MSPRFLFIAWFAANVWSSLAIHAEDWPGWGGPGGNLAALDKRVILVEQKFKLEVAWRVPLGSGYSCVSVSNGVAVTGFSDDVFNYLGAFDSNTGARLWEYQLGPVYNGPTGSHDGPIATPMSRITVSVRLPRMSAKYCSCKREGLIVKASRVSTWQQARPFGRWDQAESNNKLPWFGMLPANVNCWLSPTIVFGV